MKKHLIENYFKILNQFLDKPAEIILLGAGAGALLGKIRASMDLDFEIHVKGEAVANNSELEAAIRETSIQTKLNTNFSENVSGWSMISYLDYRKTARRYKKIGRLTIYVMAPEYWSIGKMTRFYDFDIKDMVDVFKKQKMKSGPLIALWAKAIKASQTSTALRQFRDHVEIFFTEHGRNIWGRGFDAKAAIAEFHRAIEFKS